MEVLKLLKIPKFQSQSDLDAEDYSTLFLNSFGLSSRKVIDQSDLNSAQTFSYFNISQLRSNFFTRLDKRVLIIYFF